MLNGIPTQTNESIDCGKHCLIFCYIMFIFSNALSLCRQPVLQTELLKLWSSNIKWCRLSGVSGLWTQKASYSFIFFSLPSLAETPRDPPWLPEWLKIDRKNHFSLLFFFFASCAELRPKVWQFRARTSKLFFMNFFMFIVFWEWNFPHISPHISYNTLINDVSWKLIYPM